MIHHADVGNRKVFWAPPGGGLMFSETSENAIIREFKEETNLEVSTAKFLFINEVTSTKLHAIELFFQVELVGGMLKKGTDPEVKYQMIKEVMWMDFIDINNIPENSKHNIFHNINSNQELLNLSGKIEYRF